MPDEPATPDQDSTPQDAAPPDETPATDADSAETTSEAQDTTADAGTDTPTGAASDDASATAPDADAAGESAGAAEVATAAASDADSASAAPDEGAAAESATATGEAPVDDIEAQMAAMIDGGGDGGSAAAVDDIEAQMAALLDGGEGGDASASANAAPAGKPFSAPPLDNGKPEQELANIELLDDVELDVKIELGRTEMYIADVLQLGVGSVVELDKLAGDPVDIYVNERLVARGEVLVLNDNFCVRVNDIVSPVPELEGSD